MLSVKGSTIAPASHPFVLVPPSNNVEEIRALGNAHSGSVLV